MKTVDMAVGFCDVMKAGKSRSLASLVSITTGNLSRKNTQNHTIYLKIRDIINILPILLDEDNNF